MSARRTRFFDVVDRQLEMFQSDRAGLIHDAEAALRAYTNAGRGEAEERYGDYLDLVETGQDELVELREGYAESLDARTAEEYRDVFNERVRKRLPRFGLELE
jgi:hypothetical protein